MIKIILNSVSKIYKKQEVLRDISLELESNKIHGIVGRNGSGKTVLLKLICGLSKPTSGTITVDDKVLGVDIECPDSIGIIIETPGFLSYESGFKNLEYLASLNKKISRQDIIETMKMVDLDPYSKKHVGRYSLGMKQRLGLAQAMMEKPTLVLLDEPFNGLDSESIASMRGILKKAKENGATIIIASHVQEDINVLCDTVYRIENGEMRQIT